MVFIKLEPILCWQDVLYFITCDLKNLCLFLSLLQSLWTLDVRLWIWNLNLTSMDIKPFTQPCVCFDPTPQQLSCDLHGFQDLYRHRDQIPESNEVMLACVALYTEPDTQKAVGKSRFNHYKENLEIIKNIYMTRESFITPLFNTTLYLNTSAKDNTWFST